MGNFFRKRRKTKGEFEKMGGEFYPEDEWAMPERQAEDKRRAAAKAAQRNKRYPEPTFKMKPRWNNVETDESGPGEVNGEWERAIIRTGTGKQKKGVKLRQKDRIGEVETSRNI